MTSGGRWEAVACAIALSGFAMIAPASAQPMPYAPTLMIPGPNGVLRLDEPRRGFAIDDDVISQRYLDSLPRRKVRRPIADTRRTRTADAVPPAQPPAAIQPAAPAPAESAKQKDDTDALREQVARLGSETRTLRAELAALKGELAKRTASEQRPEPPKTTAVAGNDELVKVREEAARLKDETSRLRGESDRLREQVAKLTADTGGLRGEVASLKEELAKRAAVSPAPTVTGKIDQQVGQEEPLRRGDSLKKGGKTDKAENKVVERAPGSDEREVERMASTIEKVWRRLLEMVGKPKEAP